MNYVVGFMFDETKEKVLLIEKNRPSWQAGKFNGVGGKIEPNESPEDAIVREFGEETGLYVPEWIHFCSLSNVGFTLDPTDWFVHFYYTTGDISKAKTMTDERILWLYTDNLYGTVPNLQWLIPMALTKKEDPCKYNIVEVYG